MNLEFITHLQINLNTILGRSLMKEEQESFDIKASLRSIRNLINDVSGQQ